MPWPKRYAAHLELSRQVRPGRRQHANSLAFSTLTSGSEIRHFTCQLTPTSVVKPQNLANRFWPRGLLVEMELYKTRTNEPQLIQSLHVINRSKLLDFCTCEFSSTPSLNARTAKCRVQYRTIVHSECGTPYGSAKRNSRPRNYLGLLRSSMLGAKLRIARHRHSFEQLGIKVRRETHRVS